MPSLYMSYCLPLFLLSELPVVQRQGTFHCNVHIRLVFKEAIIYIYIELLMLFDSRAVGMFLDLYKESNYPYSDLHQVTE